LDSDVNVLRRGEVVGCGWRVLGSFEEATYLVKVVFSFYTYFLGYYYS
jgi:hypothetical protein